MNIIRADADLNPDARPICAAIGVFDGVHLGHQSILRQCAEDARSRGGLTVAVTFDRHPNEVVASQHAPPMIYPLAKKLRELERAGADATWLIHFDKAFSELPAEAFIRELARRCKRLESVCVGATFTFGCRRQGNVALMRQMGAELGFATHAVEDIRSENEPVSSTRVRQAVREGNLDLAGRLLGRPYELCAIVVKGSQVGRKMGFPTANIDTTGIVIPPMGVYAAETQAGGATRRAAVNVGVRPTLGAPEPRLVVEAHVIGFNGDLYGKELELRILKKLRDEQKFPSAEALRAQIARDVTAASAEKL